MGQFSWMSVDTGEQIFNDKPAGYQKVTMVYKDVDGNIKHVTETDYEGYGEFGGIDFYDAVAWMNNIKADENEELRDKGINFYFSGVSGEFPQLYLNNPPADDKIDFSKCPEDDPNQGWTHYESDRDYDEFDTYDEQWNWDDDDDDDWDDDDEDFESDDDELDED